MENKPYQWRFCDEGNEYDAFVLRFAILQRGICEDSGGSTGGDTGGSETTTYPKWSELEDGHVFNVGDYFTDYAKTYHVLRQFTKQANWRPPALTGDFYEEVTA